MTADNTKPDCSQHPKELYGESDMKKVAEMIGDLDYQALSDLLYWLAEKAYQDGKKDMDAGRAFLANELFDAQLALHRAHQHISTCNKISKPFMKDDNPNSITQVK